MSISQEEKNHIVKQLGPYWQKQADLIKDRLEQYENGLITGLEFTSAVCSIVIAYAPVCSMLTSVEISDVNKNS